MPRKNEPQRAQPMDPSIREEKVGYPVTNNPRACWAAKTLVAEVGALYPETAVEYGGPDGRNVALDVVLDLTALNGVDADRLAALVELTETDRRVSAVRVEDSRVLVSFWSNPRTQDSRDPFGLADALDILAEDEFEGDGF